MNYTRQTPGSVQATVEQTLQRLGRATCAEIERRGQMADCASRAPLRRLHAAGQVHISDWERPEGVAMWSTVWAWGPGVDAKKPPPQPRRPKGSPFRDDMGARTPGLPMDYPVKSIFVGGVSPWVGA